MSATLTKPKRKTKKEKPSATGLNLETAPVEQGVAYLVSTYNMRQDDAEYEIAQIKASAERYSRTSE